METSSSTSTRVSKARMGILSVINQAESLASASAAPGSSAASSASKSNVLSNLSRSELSQRFQLNGLNLRSDALTLLESELKTGDPPYQSVTEFIDYLCETFARLPVENYVVGSDLAEQAVQMMRERRNGQRSKSSTAENGMDDNDFSTTPTTASEKVIIRNITIEQDHYRDQQKLSCNRGTHFPFQIGQLQRSLLRLPLFESGQYRLRSLDELNTYDSSVAMKAIVLALVRRDPSRLGNQQYLLEDSSGKVPAVFGGSGGGGDDDHDDQDLSTRWREWATFENGIYLIEGFYDGQRDLFAIESIGLPPPPAINDYLTTTTASVTSTRDSSDLTGSMAIIISEIHLDDPKTFEALKLLLTGYNSLSEVPELFVLIGDFVSRPVDQFDFKDLMKQLVKLISIFRRIASESRFVFVPGPNDINFNSDDNQNFPKNQEKIFENQFTSSHFPTTTTKIKHFHLATNPFHLQLLGRRHLCFYAEPVLSKRLARNVLNSAAVGRSKIDHKNPLSSLLRDDNPEDQAEFLRSVGRLWLSSAHLTTGQNRSFLSQLSLFPRAPDLILVADSGFQRHRQSGSLFDDHDHDRQLATLTSFSRNRFQFLVYYVDDNQMEESQIGV